MTDRFKGLLVVFESDIREDDAEQYIQLFKLIHHVVDVKPIISENNMEYQIAKSRIRRELIEKLFNAIEE